jgi:hypothetical protein
MTRKKISNQPNGRNAPPSRRQKAALLVEQKNLCLLCGGWLFPGLYSILASRTITGDGWCYTAVCFGCYAEPLEWEGEGEGGS